jgi:hypothetical protein
VAAVSLLLSGCVTHPVTVEIAPPPADARGHISMRPGRPGTVVAAPPGPSDPRSGEVASEIARRTGFGLVVATGSTRAAGDDEYERRVREAARGPLALYVEIHGSRREEAAPRIEIGTAGVDETHALQLKTLLELTRDPHLRTRVDAPRLEILIEPADTVFAAAGGARRDAILRLAERALHIELPRVARRDVDELYTAILADFLAEAARLRPPR